MTALHPGVTEATIVIRVAGRPAPQGSKTRTRFAMRDSNAATLHPWRDAVRHEVQARIWGGLNVPSYVRDEAERITGPVSVSVTFTLPKPASAPKRRRTWPTGKRSGDLDKLLRAVLDGITDGGLWRDDSQVVHFADVWKLYVGDPGAEVTPGAVISVTPITEDL